MISVDAALETILAHFAPLREEMVHILDALGRVLAEDIYAPRDIPPTNNSAMDGYAVRAVDTVGATPDRPVVLTVIEDIPAGSFPQKEVGPGQAARIMTGAPLPAGADAVVRMEDTRKDGRHVAVLVTAPPGLDIRLAGEDVRRGDLVIPRGRVIRPAEVGMMAALGRSFVAVHQRPLVAILATGDELTSIDETGEPWQIKSSNSFSTAAQVMECGAVPLQLGIARDRREELADKFQAAARADVIISSGGVSVGDYDLVKEVMQEMGNAMSFWQVAMRPGKPLAFGRLGGVPLFGLPGNPVSSMVSFEQFVRPALLKMMGHRRIFRKVIRAVLTESIAKKRGMRYFLRGVVEKSGEGYVVRTTGEQGSGILKSLVLANGLIVLPEDIEKAAAGDEVNVQLLDDSLDKVDRNGN
ncbi:MAG: molybdopterin molybdotransferase MoeA [Syntrophales bacterium]|nr:molybdopterin molybdotransferase MoeA [Syntrophales bacterium]